MRRTATEEKRQAREHSLWYGVLTAVLPLTAAVLTAAFVCICAVYGSVRAAVTIELGTDSPEAVAFSRKGAETVYASAPAETYRKPGNYRLFVRSGGRAVPVWLRVRDTEAPAAEGRETTVSIHESPSPDRLIRNLRDQSIVKVSFLTAPRYGTVGDYEAVVLLEDTSRNRTRVPVTVHVRVAKDELIAEAGSPAPKAEAFLIGTYRDVQIDPITDDMMKTPGEYPIRITADGLEATTTLIVCDTVAPVASGITRVVMPGETIDPDMMVKDVVDETAVQAAFETEPDPENRRAQTVRVKLTDLGGNETTVESVLLFSNIRPAVIEARYSAVTAEELAGEADGGKTVLNGPFIPNVPGTHVISVMVDGEENLAVIDVCDTTPPRIRILADQAYRNTPLAADAFAEATDVTETTLRFVTEPDWSKPEQEVTIEATDTSGNRSEASFVLRLAEDVEPPKLYGVVDRYCYVGEPIAYLAEVSAWDDCDGECTVTVDASAVDNMHTGEYPVTYTTTDRANNSVSKTVLFRMVKAKVSNDRVQEVAEEILDEILTDDMTLAEQIEAIYDYVFYNVRYVATSNKQDWRSEAVRGLTTGRGDCFTSYAAARLLLEHTDAQIISVTRQSMAHHYWMLVNIGTGWYHFDACRAWTGKYRCFMWTDADARRHSRTYWKYDKSLYPPVATEPYDGGD